MRRFPFLILLSSLAACTHYADPLVGDTARLRIVSLPGNPTEVYTLDQANCVGKHEQLVARLGVNIKDGVNQGRSLEMLLPQALPRDATTEIKVNAQQAIAFQIHANSAKGPRGAGWSYPNCTRSFRLVAKADEQYEAQLEQQPAECQLNIFRLSREKDGSYTRRIAATAQPLKTRCK